MKTVTLKLPPSVEVPEECISKLRSIAAYREMSEEELIADMLKAFMPSNIDCDFENMDKLVTGEGDGRPQ